jgi:hypothetical protein
MVGWQVSPDSHLDLAVVVDTQLNLASIGLIGAPTAM